MLLPHLAHAAANEPIVSNGMYVGARINPGQNVPPLVIWPDNKNMSSSCRSVSNSGDVSMFVPFKSMVEWKAFLANHPAGQASIGNCCQPKTVDICGDKVQLGQRTVLTWTKTLSSYGAEDDVFGPYYGKNDYKVTYVCQDGDWINIQESGSCDGRPICSSSQNKKSLTSLNGSVSKLCQSGTAINVPTNLKKGPWDWQCRNDQTMETVNCSATQNITPPECGAQAGKVLNTFTNSSLCKTGTVTNLSSSNTFQGPWTWTCENNGLSESCYANQSSNIAGMCGSNNGKALSSKPSMSSLSTCKAGQPTNLQVSAAVYKWICAGKGTGASETCSATIAPSTIPVKVNGSCGSADGTAVPLAPNKNICETGSASARIGSGPWTWTCKGSNGGTTASCKADLCQACMGSYNDFAASEPTNTTANIDGKTCYLSVRYRWKETISRQPMSGKIDAVLRDRLGLTFKKTYDDLAAEPEYCSPCQLRRTALADAVVEYKAIGGQCPASFSSTEYQSQVITDTELVRH